MFDFASKKEATITVALAAFFVLVTIGFTFEPLATVILKSRDLPQETVLLAKILADTSNEQILADGKMLLGEKGVVFKEGETLKRSVNALLSSVTGERTLNIITQSAGALPVTLTLSGKTNEEYAAKPLVKLIAAYENPSENRITMPDNTTYIEFVADPDKANPTKLPIPLSINTHEDITTISTSKNPLEKANKYLSPLSCEELPSGTKIINFAKNRDYFLRNVLFSTKQYLANFECFQSFSTFH